MTPEKLAKANRHGVCVVPLKTNGKSLESLRAGSKTMQQSEKAIHETTQTSCTEDDITFEATEKGSKS